MPLFVQCVPSFRVSIFPYSYIVFPKGDVSQSLSTFYFLLQSLLLFFLLVFLLSRDTSARASVLKTSPRSKSAVSKPKGKRYLGIFSRSRRVVFLGPTHRCYSTSPLIGTVQLLGQLHKYAKLEWFSLECRKKFAFAFLLFFYALCVASKTRTPFQPIRSRCDSLAQVFPRFAPNTYPNLRRVLIGMWIFHDLFNWPDLLIWFSSKESVVECLLGLRGFN